MAEVRELEVKATESSAAAAQTKVAQIQLTNKLEEEKAELANKADALKIQVEMLKAGTGLESRRKNDEEAADLAKRSAILATKVRHDSPSVKCLREKRMLTFRLPLDSSRRPPSSCSRLRSRSRLWLRPRRASFRKSTTCKPR